LAEGARAIPIVVQGLGPIGQAIARAALETPDLRIVGAIDPAHAGRPLGDLLGAAAPSLEIAREPGKALAAGKGGVLIHAATSDVEEAEGHLLQALRAGLSVVSTCEELAYPWLDHEELAARIDRMAESRDLAVVGTGINPGFVLDRLPALLSQVVGPVRHVRGERVLDAFARRGPLRRKVGMGLEPAEFDAAAERGTIGHVGLAQSAALAALGCGFELDEVEETIEPVIAERDLHGTEAVAKGKVAGLAQEVRGFVDGQERVRLSVTMAAGAPSPHDELVLDARPPLRLSVPGGIPGDDGTVWSVIHATLPITFLRGLVTVLDLPAGR
jgi:hypothetical protein